MLRCRRTARVMTVTITDTPQLLVYIRPSESANFNQSRYGSTAMTPSHFNPNPPESNVRTQPGAHGVIGARTCPPKTHILLKPCPKFNRDHYMLSQHSVVILIIMHLHPNLVAQSTRSCFILIVLYKHSNSLWSITFLSSLLVVVVFCTRYRSDIFRTSPLYLSSCAVAEYMSE
ncbi:hypothetical protein PAXRUDRAFT_228316 [Paxillus rubicundulus Ve08.2h10]|uniref:Uncharacterized protein n=1 Tax=Paxillus rubicundulus Ve08.2h10 TaxID=930991 RepID=A0A0D0DTR3_9AGAM|nr:hypothetical protein PAXRUDRAFT_228316 [Paxillus rubicundulus Ve08.2h10]